MEGWVWTLSGGALIKRAYQARQRHDSTASSSFLSPRRSQATARRGCDCALPVSAFRHPDWIPQRCRPRAGCEASTCHHARHRREHSRPHPAGPPPTGHHAAALPQDEHFTRILLPPRNPTHAGVTQHQPPHCRPGTPARGSTQAMLPSCVNMQARQAALPWVGKSHVCMLDGTSLSTT